MTELRTSPHLTGSVATEQIMRQVALALLPIVGFSYYLFGLSSLLLVLVCVTTCLSTEWVSCRLRGEISSLKDASALVTGLLLALTLPPALPLWMAAAGSAFAMVVGKIIFGGLGYNLFNPALVGRAFLMAAFPVALTTWQSPDPGHRFTSVLPGTLTLPFLRPLYDGLSSATPLSAFKFEGQSTAYSDLYLGYVGGSAGETSAVLIALCGLYLALRGFLDWRIPIAISGTVALLSALFYMYDTVRFPDPLFMLGSGGLALGAVFMATDMVTSPVTRGGVWLFGIVIGSLTYAIRILGGLPEGMMYAILLGNALTPLLQKFSQHRVYGTRS